MFKTSQEFKEIKFRLIKLKSRNYSRMCKNIIYVILVILGLLKLYSIVI